MLSENIRKRIAALNRGSLRHALEAPSEEEAVVPKAERDPGGGDFRISATASDAHLTAALEEVADGAEVRSEAGCFFLIDPSFQDLFSSGGEAFEEQYVRLFDAFEREETFERLHESLHPLAKTTPEDLLYVDIETTGLSAGTPLFLVGALVFSKGSLKVRQLLARDYTEEAALLDYFSGLLEGARVVVSFNGKSFDLPYIRDRSIFHGIPFHLRQAHIDLLHEARRRWRKRLPNCKLQTLEQYICKRLRYDDIPGAEIPDAYHRFVRSGNAVQMREILHHNALDLITMAEVLVFMLEGPVR